VDTVAQDHAATRFLARGLLWERFADGHVHRLKRGKHYRGEIQDVKAEAEAAAAVMGKHAVVVKDPMGHHYFLWVQFVDGEISMGDPCPCGHRTLVRVHKAYVRCPACDAVLRLDGKFTDMEELEDEDQDEPDLEENLERHRMSADARREEKLRLQRQKKDAARDSRPPETLDDFTDVELKLFRHGDGKEVWRGHGLSAGGALSLLLVTYRLDPDGARREDPERPGEHLYRLTSMRVGPFGDAIDISRL
jgi:hypothetical protein